MEEQAWGRVIFCSSIAAGDAPSTHLLVQILMTITYSDGRCYRPALCLVEVRPSWNHALDRQPIL